MAPLRTNPNSFSARRRSSLGLMGSRRRSFAPKSYTFAQNVTPITYPSDTVSPTSNARSSSSPNPEGVESDIKDTDDLAALAALDAAMNASASMPAPSRPRRRNGRKESVDHIPRPPNAFMLFRQNFVHQRHVPGSIETNHNSLSKIVGNCWKALPDKDRKIWEALAEKKKEEHKRQYPDYRFQPKHDPEKKKKRQEARAAAERAERERIIRERKGAAAGTSDPIPEEETAEGGLKLQTVEQEREQKELAMKAKRDQMRERHNHLGHRRSSSVPLPSETYPGYPYSSQFGNAYGQNVQNVDPFNFAAPLAPLSGSPAGNGIALPTLPSGMGNNWYAPGDVDASQQQQMNSDQTNGGQLSLPPHLTMPAPQSMTLSRAASPRIPMTSAGMGSIGGGFGGFSGMSSMGMGLGGMNTMGMGPRASRQYHLGQLGRRASSTQPILQHQLASGAFNNYSFGAPSSFPHPGFGQQNMFPQQHQYGIDGFVGAVAEGFTNPFAPASASSGAQEVDPSPTASNPNSAPPSASGAYPAPLAPNAMWYNSDPVDPMTPVQPQQQQAQFAHVSAPTSSLPSVDTALLNPAFNFGGSSKNVGSASGSSLEAPPSPKSASASAPHSAMHNHTHFGPMSAPALGSGANSAPGTGMRDSFDFSAFNGLFNETAQTQNQHHQHEQQRNFDNVPPHAMTSFTLAQPVPVRKVGLPCVPETHALAPVYHDQQQQPAYQEHGSYQEHYAPEQTYAQEQVQSYQEQPQYASSQQSASNSTGSSANASPASGFAQMGTHHQHQSQSQQQQGADVVSGHELLDGPVDVNSAHAQQSQMQSDAACAPGAVDYGAGYDYHGMGMSQGMYPMHAGLGVDMNMGYDAYGAPQSGEQDTGANANGEAASRFSFSDYMHGSPFTSSATVAN